MALQASGGGAFEDGARSAAPVAVVIPAHDEERRIGATVRAARVVDGVDLVVVVDDGSRDGTVRAAAAAGAVVVRHGRNRGKAAAMETGAAAVAAVDAREGRRTPETAHLLLFLDGDLEESAANTAPLVDPVRAGTAAMSIAVLPPQKRAGGGHGFVVRAARDGIRRASGFIATQPLSGQRCLTREAFDAALPLAAGFGVETGLTIDLVRQGYPVCEVEVDLHHRVTGKDWAAQRHRAKQYAHVARALAERGAVGALPGALRAGTSGGTVEGDGVSREPGGGGS
ncbi:glycosyltransferase [Yinghuangia seranimata]|uniref:glycosyltransferase n=1 Tax=Yinghuangia seranimata TaxID=408067 RepID=UPI00248A9276|nr:glycosyltransferase [Yinghuangia seranimata]MDI2131896.1 glycosyltransferase [Yinghuangia seranimata]